MSKSRHTHTSEFVKIRSCMFVVMAENVIILDPSVHEHVPQSGWLGSYFNIDQPGTKQPMHYAIVQTIESTNEGEKKVISSMVCPEWISECHKYLLYPRLTASKTSQPFYWENSRFMSNRNPKSSWLEYEVHKYLNPHDLKSFDKIKKRLNLLSSGEALTWEESEPERPLGLGKQKKTIIPGIQMGPHPKRNLDKKNRSKSSIKRLSSKKFHHHHLQRII